MELASYGDLAVRLVNTAGPDPAQDRLRDVSGLRLLLADHPTWRSRVTEEDVARLRSLRGKLRGVFERAAAGEDQAAVRSLNGLLSESVIRPQISGHDAEEWHLHLYEGAPQTWRAYEAAAVMGLAVQLTQAGLDRFGVCQGAPCRNVFVDTSTNRSRRYCSERCATRANVAAYRARRRAAG